MRPAFPALFRLTTAFIIFGFISFYVFPLRHIELATEKKKSDAGPQKRIESFKPDSRNDNSSKEIARDNGFIAYSNGTVSDSRTGLMWAASDNGEDISWHDAKKYCEDYLGGWYDDWRMPTLFELAGLYNTGDGYKQECCSSCSRIRINELIKLTCCCLWALETDGSGAAHFVFHDGFRGWNLQTDYVINRVLPVRSDD